MTAQIEKTVADFIKQHGLVPPRSHILLAVSGGADSTAMAHILAKLRDGKVIEGELTIAHVNHHLRDEAGEDEEFCHLLAEELGTDYYCEHIDVRGYADQNSQSIETAARNLRLRTLVEIAEKCRCTAIATAHHADDNAETVIHRLIRGTGYRGLAGIYPAGDIAGQNFIRPILCLAREQILTYLTERELGWRVDHTNAETEYTRNRIRHLLLPYLCSGASGQLVAKLNRLSELCQGMNEQIEQAAREHFSEAMVKESASKIRLNREKLQALPEPIVQAIVRIALTKLNLGERNISARHYYAMDSTIKTGRPRAVNLPGGYQLRAKKELIIIKVPPERG